MKSKIPHPAPYVRTTSFLVSRVLTPRDLAVFGTVLEVPVDHVAVQIGTHGAARLLGPGKHKVSGLLSRRLPLIGLVSRAAFPCSADITGILAGGAHGELLDGDVHYGLRVAEPGLFFERVGEGRSELRARDLARWLEPKIQAVLQPLASQYAVADLIGEGLASEKLLGWFREQLAVRLAELGLAVEWVRKPTFCRAGDKVSRVRHMQALRQKLREIELDDRMDEAQKQAELEDFRRQLSAERTTQTSREDFTLLKGAYPLTPDNLRRVDSTFCQQVRAELSCLWKAAQESRSRVYGEGNIELALRLKRLQRQIEIVADDIEGVRPAYLSIQDLPEADLKRALAQDGQVLIYAQSLNDDGQTALAETFAGREAVPRWAEIEAKLPILRHQCVMRSRLSQPEAIET